MLKPSDLDLRRRAGIEMITQAGVHALEVFNQIAISNDPSTCVKLKGPQDFLTEADIAVEQMLHERISTLFPEDNIYGEEEGGCLEGNTWVIDPIDGTANFARGIPHFCIIIAFVCDDITQFGLIYDPIHEELFQARLGQGAWINERPLNVAKTANVSAANLELGWSLRVPQSRYLKTYQNLIELCGNVRRSACGGLALAYVACGRSDGYVELHMNPWDCLAGLLMVKEAGGVANRFTDQDNWKQGGAVLAAIPKFSDMIAQSTQIKL